MISTFIKHFLLNLKEIHEVSGQVFLLQIYPSFYCIHYRCEAHYHLGSSHPKAFALCLCPPHSSRFHKPPSFSLSGLSLNVASSEKPALTAPLSRAHHTPPWLQPRAGLCSLQSYHCGNCMNYLHGICSLPAPTTTQLHENKHLCVWLPSTQYQEQCVACKRCSSIYWLNECSHISATGTYKLIIFHSPQMKNEEQQQD